MKQPENMTLKELVAIEQKIAKVIPVVRERERVTLRRKMEAIAAEHGLRLGQLLGQRSGAAP